MDHSGLKRIFQVLSEEGAHHVQVIRCEHLEGPLYIVGLKFLIKADGEPLQVVKH